MKQYKANLNPILSFNFSENLDKVGLFTAYQEYRARMSVWVPSEQNHAAAKASRKSSPELVAALRKQAINMSVDALTATLDFQSSWGSDSEPSELAGDIFYHIAEWSDEVNECPFPLSRKMVQRDIAEEISEASARLHAAVCEEVGL